MYWLLRYTISCDWCSQSQGVLTQLSSLLLASLYRYLLEENACRVDVDVNLHLHPTPGSRLQHYLMQYIARRLEVIIL